MATDAEIRTALEEVVDPEIHLSIIELGLVREIDQSVEPFDGPHAPHDAVLPLRSADHGGGQGGRDARHREADRGGDPCRAVDDRR